MADTLRQRALAGWARWVCRRPALILSLAVLLTVGSVAYSALYLRFQPDRNALISPQLDWNKRFEDWRNSFPGSQDMYVVIDLGDASGEKRKERYRRAKALADELAAALIADPEIEHVTWRYPTSEFGPRTLRLRPWAQFQERLIQMRDAEILLENPTPQHLFQSVQKKMVQAMSADSPVRKELEAAGTDGIVHMVDSFSHFVESVDKTLKSAPQDRKTLGQMLEQNDQQWQYLESGRMLFIRVTPNVHRDQLDMFAASINACRTIIPRISAKYPNLTAGLTGIDVIESDETTVAVRDATIASIIAVILISILLIVAFHSWRTPVLAMIALLMGIAWSFGFVTLSIGYLQVISVIFTAILLGLGIDFGIHLASGFELARHEHPDEAEGSIASVSQSMRIIGPGVLTGALTTAIAFATTLFTDFKGVSEMGMIAGAGVLLCLLAMFSVYPVLLRLGKPNHKHVVRIDNRKLHLFDERWIMPFVKRPGMTLVMTAIVVGASLFGALRIGFNYDLLQLFPRGTDSYRWYRKVVDHGDQSIWTAISVADDLQQARQLKEKLVQQEGDLIARFDGVAILFPDDDEKKIEQIKEVEKDFADIIKNSTSAPDEPTPELVAQVRPLVGMISLAQVSADVPQELKPGIQRVNAALNNLLMTHNALEAAVREQRLDTLQSEYSTFRKEIRSQLTQIFDTSSLTPDDVPAEFIRPYIATDGPLKGKVALEIYPRVPPEYSDSGALDPRYLPGFVTRLDKAVAPQGGSHLTGVMVQIYRSGALIESSYRWAGLYALTVVFLLVLLDFRSLHDAVLCLVPVATGFTVTFGIMYLLGMSINPANIIVLPLMFGIGVDVGVHVMHRYRQAPLDRPAGLTFGTGKGITLTSFTTMIGFGSMLFSQHRGVASLAFVMTVGIGLTLVACWTVMPCWLELRTRRLERKNAANALPAPVEQAEPDASQPK